MPISNPPAPGAPLAHESTHVSGGSDDIDSALAIAAMADLASTKIWQGNVGNRPVEVAMPAGAATKEFFLPFIRGTEPLTLSNIWPYYRCSGANHWCAASFYVPEDFTAIDEAVLLVLVADTQASANWDIYSWYATVGEDKNNHSESDVATTYNVTQDQLYEVDISGILSALAAGDFVGVEIINATGAGHRFFGFGVRFKYN